MNVSDIIFVDRREATVLIESLDVLHAVLAGEGARCEGEDCASATPIPADGISAEEDGSEEQDAANTTTTERNKKCTPLFHGEDCEEETPNLPTCVQGVYRGWWSVHAEVVGKNNNLTVPNLPSKTPSQGIP